MRKNQKYSREQMYNAIELCHREGISPKDYCQQHQIPYPSFQYWLRKYRNEKLNQHIKSENGFLPVRFEDMPQSNSNQLTIAYPNGIQVLCPLNTPVQVLQSLIIS